MPAQTFLRNIVNGGLGGITACVLAVLVLSGPARGQVGTQGQSNRTDGSTGYGRVWRDGHEIKVTRWMDFQAYEPLTYEQWQAQVGESGPFEVTPVREIPSLKTAAQGEKFCVLVNTALYPEIQFEVERYVIELTGEGYDVELYTSFGGTPQDLRAFLQTRYSSGLEGCLLVGDFPVAWYEVGACWGSDPPYHEEFPCDLYYMDLDGTFIDGDGDGKFDSHTGSIGPEIYLGRLTASTLHLGGANEVSLLKNYFEKNHLYRSELRPLNSRALVYVDDDWSPGDYWDDNVALVYGERTFVDDVWTTWDTDYEGRLDDNYEFIQVCAHSDATEHLFANPVGWSETTVEEMKAIGPLAYFYNLYACSNARYIEVEYMAGWYIFGQDYGLAAVGSAKVGGMLNLGAFYGPFGDGMSFGEAFRDWLIAETGGGYQEWLACWDYGMTVIGDPTLKRMAPAVVTKTLQCDDGQVSDEFGFPNAEGADLPNMRFTAAQACTLTAAMVNARLAGSPGARIYVWNNPGGFFPGTVIDSIDASAAALTGGEIDLSARQIAFQAGSQFHLGFRMLPSAPGDTIWLRAGDFTCSPSQSVVWVDGMWKTAWQVWPGRSIGFMIRAVARCLDDTLRVTPVILPDGAVDVPYSQILQATGGVPPYSWQIVAGALPDGVTLNPAAGIISGTPTLAGTGTHVFTVRVTDAHAPSWTDIQHLSISVPYCVDSDGDGLGDPDHPENTCDDDNCPLIYNSVQEDVDGDGTGDSCEVIRSWRVQADGLGDARTIQEAIDSCTHRDSVLLADGVYWGTGNCDIDFRGRRILLHSENGPANAVIDCGGTAAQPRRGFIFQNGEDSSHIVDGLTIRRGYGGSFIGGLGGGGMLFRNSSPIVRNCVFYSDAGGTGGGILAYNSSPQFVGCTFAADSAQYGAAVFAFDHSHPTLENCILAFQKQGSVVLCLENSSVTLSCCDSYGNTGGDWPGCIAGQQGVNGNFSADPLFCNLGTGNLGLQFGSPCAAEQNSCGVLIGACPVGCTCDCSGFCDVNRDGAINPTDVVVMVNFVYKGQDTRQQLPLCPGNNGDWNCDGAVNPGDVVSYVNFVYKSTGSPCDPCAP